MKKLLSIFATLLFSITMTYASVLQHRQEEHHPERPQETREYSSHSTHPDGFILVDGHVMRIKNMTMSKLKRRFFLRNGTKILPNGMCTDRRGHKMMLRENEHLDMRGNRVMMNRVKRK